MLEKVTKLTLIAFTAGFLIIFCNLPDAAAEEDVIALAPEMLAPEIQGHENTSPRKARQFGFPPPPPPPPPPFGGPFGYRPPPPPPPPGFGYGRPGFGGPGFGGGFGRQRVITRTRTRYVNVNRYRG